MFRAVRVVDTREEEEEEEGSPYKSVAPFSPIEE